MPKKPGLRPEHLSEFAAQVRQITATLEEQVTVVAARVGATTSFGRRFVAAYKEARKLEEALRDRLPRSEPEHASASPSTPQDAQLRIRLRQARAYRDLTLEELGQRVGCHWRTIKRCEQEGRWPKKQEHRVRLAFELGIGAVEPALARYLTPEQRRRWEGQHEYAVNGHAGPGTGVWSHPVATGGAVEPFERPAETPEQRHRRQHPQQPLYATPAASAPALQPPPGLFPGAQ